MRRTLLFGAVLFALAAAGCAYPRDFHDGGHRGGGHWDRYDGHRDRDWRRGGWDRDHDGDHDRWDHRGRWR